jgi:undecaprenyl-diphosphatase
MDVNGSIFDGVNELGGHVPLLDHAMVYAAQYAVFVAAFLVVISWFVHAGAGQDRRVGVYSAVASAAIALGITALIQHFYVHQRPFVVRGDVVLLLKHSADPSFPSEHAAVAFGLAAGIGLYRARFGIALLALACLTAFSRVYVGVHYPADVSAGALVGIGGATLVWLVRPVLASFDRLVVLRIVPAALR